MTWKYDDDDIPKGTQGTVIGFPESKDKRVRVKFPRDFWDLKAEELEKVTATTFQYTTQYAAPTTYVNQGYVDGGVIYADGGLVAPTTYLETVEPTMYMETVAPTTYVEEGAYIMDGGFVAPTVYAEPAIYTQY